MRELLPAIKECRSRLLWITLVPLPAPTPLVPLERKGKRTRTRTATHNKAAIGSCLLRAGIHLLDPRVCCREKRTQFVCLLQLASNTRRCTASSCANFVYLKIRLAKLVELEGRLNSEY